MACRSRIVILSVVCCFTICADAAPISDRDVQNANKAPPPSLTTTNNNNNDDVVATSTLNKRFNNIVFTPSDYHPVSLLQKMIKNTNDENGGRPRKMDTEFGGTSGNFGSGRRMRFGGGPGKSMSHLTDLLNTGVAYGIRWGRRR